MVYCSEVLRGQASFTSEVRWAQPRSLKVPGLLVHRGFPVKVVAFHPSAKDLCADSCQHSGKWELCGLR